MQFLRRHPAEAFACAIWLAYAVLETWIASGAVLLAAIWALHGLVLMLAMKLLLDHAPRDHGALRIAVFVVAPLGFTVLQTSLDMLVTQWVGQHVLGKIPISGVSPVGVRFDVVFKLNMRVYLWIFGFYAATLALMGAMRETYQARRQKDRAELDALRLQVNPHLLFNALNSISSLIVQGELERAETMTMGLADFYRTNLTSDGSDVVSLDEEMEAIEAYIDFEMLRFESLAVTIDCPIALGNAQVPRLILQPLVENAVKFSGDQGMAAAPISIGIQAHGDRLEIRVENCFSDVAKEGTGTGLSNVRGRLQSYFGDRGTLVSGAADGRWRAVATMPLLLETTSPA